MSTQATVHIGENFHAYEEVTEHKDNLHVSASVHSRWTDITCDLRISEADENALCDALISRREWRAKLAARKGG